MSEEFLRNFQGNENTQSTLSEVVAPGETLFPDEKAHKAEARDKAKEKQGPSS